MMNVRHKLLTQLPIAIAVLVSIITTPLNAQTVKIPETQSGKRVSELINAVNSESQAELKQFLASSFSDLETSTIEQRMQHANSVKDQFGKLKLVKVLSSEKNQTLVLCSGSKGMNIELGIRTEKGRPHKISNIRMRMVQPPKPLTADLRAEIVKQTAKSLRNKYVFPETGMEMADAILKSLKDGDYDKVTEREQLASSLTKQLRTICNDLHLRVKTSPRRAPRKEGNRFVDNHGFVKAEMLPGGIGYLRFDYFSDNPEAQKTAAAAMNFLGNSKAVIFDLRYNGGGSPKMIAFLTSYIIDKPTHLNSFYNRPSDTTTESWTHENVPGKRLGSKVPVYVLTSRRSFSGAEEFSYNLKHLNRGTIIGEVTGGGAHPVRGEPLPGGFEMSVPFARAINPITKKNWEGVGVIPHIKVSASEALDRAVELAQSGKTLVSGKVASPKESGETLSVPQLRGQARNLMSSQDFAGAEKVFKQIVASGKATPADHFNFGYCLHAGGKLDQAMKYHRLAAKSDQFAPIATYNIACVYSLQNKKDEAFKSLNKAVELGFGDSNQFKNDSDLSNLRKDPRFKKLLDELNR